MLVRVRSYVIKDGPEKRPRRGRRRIEGGGRHSVNNPLLNLQLARGRAIFAPLFLREREDEHVDPSAGSINGAHVVLAEPQGDPKEG